MKLVKQMLTGLSLTCAVLSASSYAADYTIKYAHNDPVSDISKGHVPALFFKQYVEQKSDGAIEVQIFPSGQLGGDQDTIQMVQAGALEVAQVSMGGIANFAPELQVLDLPYLLPNDMVAEELFNGVLPQEVNKTFQAKLPNVRIAAVSNLARWRSFFTTDKEIRSLDDLKGMKIRTIQSKLQQEFVRAVGATPVSVPFGEVYTGLATGMADGLKNSVNDMIEFAWVENVKHGYVDRHTNLMGFFAVGEPMLKKLPEDLRAVVLDGVVQTAALQTQFNKMRERKATEEFMKKGGKLYFPKDADKAKFDGVKTHMIDWYKAQFGEEWLVKYNALIADAEKNIESKRM